MGTNASNQQLSMGNLLAAVMQNCGAHGIPNIGRSSSYHRRIVWTLLFVCSLVMFAGTALTMFSMFSSYDVAVNVELEYEREMTFPAVTLCNLNRITRSRLYESEELRQLILDHKLSTENKGTDVDYTSTNIGYKLMLHTLNIIATMPYQERFSTGHRLEEMLLTCTFKGYPCTPKNFTHFYNAMYGNCYTFNFLRENVQKVNKIGPLYGLTMELFIQQDEYLPSMQQSAGMRVLVGSQNQVPFPEDEGITVSPGQETFIAVRKVEIDRSKAPYRSNCTTTQSTIFSQFFNNITYSKQACEKSCLSEIVLTACGCADQRYRFSDAHLPCLSTNVTQERCNARVVAEYISGALTCDCQLQCSEELFELTVSNAQWPIESYKAQVVSALRTFPEFPKENLAVDFVEKNTVKFNVYLGSQFQEHIYEIPAYDFMRFLSDIGGSLGLWMGISVLTLFELFEFIFDLVKIAILRINGNKKVNTTVVNVKPFDDTNSTGGHNLSISAHM